MYVIRLQQQPKVVKTLVCVKSTVSKSRRSTTMSLFVTECWWYVNRRIDVEGFSRGFTLFARETKWSKARYSGLNGSPNFRVRRLSERRLFFYRNLTAVGEIRVRARACFTLCMYMCACDCVLCTLKCSIFVCARTRV